MHDQSPPPNGFPAWQPPSPWDMLLSRLDRIDYHLMQQGSLIGGLKQGQESGLDNDREIFWVLRSFGDRLSTVETQLEQQQASGPPPTAAPGLLASITEALPSAKALIGLGLWFLAALGVAVTPESAKALIELLGAVN
jgi:hypothetical protein